MLGLGPASVLLFVAPTVLVALLFVLPLGYLLLKCAWERPEERKHSGRAKTVATPPKPKGQPKPSVGPGDVFGEYHKWKQKDKQQHVRWVDDGREG